MNEVNFIDDSTKIDCLLFSDEMYYTLENLITVKDDTEPSSVWCINRSPQADQDDSVPDIEITVCRLITLARWLLELILSQDAVYQQTPLILPFWLP